MHIGTQYCHNLHGFLAGNFIPNLFTTPNLRHASASFLLGRAFNFKERCQRYVYCWIALN
jgi:hypothetical protein